MRELCRLSVCRIPRQVKVTAYFYVEVMVIAVINQALVFWGRKNPLVRSFVRNELQSTAHIGKILLVLLVPLSLHVGGIPHLESSLSQMSNKKVLLEWGGGGGTTTGEEEADCPMGRRRKTTAATLKQSLHINLYPSQPRAPSGKEPESYYVSTQKASTLTTRPNLIPRCKSCMHEDLRPPKNPLLLPDSHLYAPVKAASHTHRALPSLNLAQRPESKHVAHYPVSFAPLLCQQPLPLPSKSMASSAALLETCSIKSPPIALSSQPPSIYA